jgi:hypothetical protein
LEGALNAFDDRAVAAGHFPDAFFELHSALENATMTTLRILFLATALGLAPVLTALAAGGVTP